MKRDNEAEILRDFMKDIGNKESGVRLIRNHRRVAVFLESRMDELSRDERLQVYGMLEGMFSKYFERILKARLASESDPECLAELHAISQYRERGEP